MAKVNKAMSTRIATTVTARYHPTTGASDGFYLDGRISGRREHRAADITLDREDRGFFFAIYAHMAGNAQPEKNQEKIKKPLDKIWQDIKQPGSNIDDEINELAECAISVAGRIALQNENLQQPYFAGILVKDAEMAAITMGDGCAYLYRDDVLYPLTNDDFPLKPIDFAGKPVEGLDVYCAGVAGTVRYSNIAQLQLDDCLIVCNRELMEALSQREVLRMLYEAEDQADAAGMIITEAAAKLPGTPMQFMIGFVEDIVSQEKAGRIAFSRSTAGETAQVSQTAAFPTLGRGRGQAAGQAVGQQDKQPGFQTGKKTGPSFPLTAKKEQLPFSGKDETLPVKPQHGQKAALQDQDYFADDDDEGFGDEIDSYGRGRRIAFYIIIFAICIGCVVLIYKMLFGGSKKPQPSESGTVPAVSSTAASEETFQTTASQPAGTSQAEETTAATETDPSQPAEDDILARHTVVAGDSPWALANKYYNSTTREDIERIMGANGKEYDDMLKVGDVLIIPKK